MKKRKFRILATMLVLTLSLMSMTAFAATMAGICSKCHDDCSTVTAIRRNPTGGDQHIVNTYDEDVCNSCGHVENSTLIDSYYEAHSYTYNYSLGIWQCICGDSY